MTLIKQKCFFLLPEPFNRLPMPKLERLYNLQIDIVLKRKELYWLKMLFNKLINIFVSFWDGIDPQTAYKMLLLYILWLEEGRQTVKGKPGRNFQNVCFTVTRAPLCSKAAFTLFHVSARQLRRNVKAYSRNIGRSHSSIQ